MNVTLSSVLRLCSVPRGISSMSPFIIRMTCCRPTAVRAIRHCRRGRPSASRQPRTESTRQTRSNVITPFVPLELGRALVLLRRQNNLHRDRSRRVQLVVAGRRVQRLHIIGEFARLPKLDRLRSGVHIRSRRGLRHRHQRIGKGETSHGGNRCRAEKVAARRVDLAMRGSESHPRLVCQDPRPIPRTSA